MKKLVLGFAAICSLSLTSGSALAGPLFGTIWEKDGPREGKVTIGNALFLSTTGTLQHFIHLMAGGICS